MEAVLSGIGLIAIITLAICLIKKLDDFFYERKIRSEVSDKVCQAATAFAGGETEEAVKAILITCIDFDEDDINEVLSGCGSFRGDGDGGYQGFIRTARKVLKHY